MPKIKKSSLLCFACSLIICMAAFVFLGESEVKAAQKQNYNTYLLAKVISGESRGEPYTGKVAVGAVIMNRIKNDDFPDTLSGVVYQKLAFESVSNGYYNRPPDSQSIRAARQAIAGWDPTYGALYFWNPAKSSSTWIWSRSVTMRIGDHVFGI